MVVLIFFNLVWKIATMTGAFKKDFVIIGVYFLLINFTCFLNAEDHGIGKFDYAVNDENNVTSSLHNFNEKNRGKQHDEKENLENTGRVFKNKADILARLLKIHVDRLRNQTDQVELVFLVDASGSVGLTNFRSELNFVRKLLSDFTVEPKATRVALVTFGGKRKIRRNIDQISRSGENDHKCYLLNKQLNNVTYTGGGTYTRGALMEALAILEKGRDTAKKVVFLITDGFSNGGDPRPAANLLKSAGATIFTFGIRTGNVEELHDIASYPGYTHSYLLDSFAEFEALARRALHRDLRSGQYALVSPADNCNTLCTNITQEEDPKKCCDGLATCACGLTTGHYACLCPAGYFGSGFKGFCQPCPNGTYASGEISGDATSICLSCPDVNHVTIKIPATSIEHCMCASGFITSGNKCEVITCPKLKVPENGYLVKANACNNVVHAACGIRCRIGFHLTGDSIRLCGKNGTWSGNEPKCLLKTCLVLRAPAHGRMRCQHEEDYQHRIKNDSTAYPIDTRCQFKCETGYQLRGSKVRNCLPLAQWDGLKATCRAIKCEPLKQIANGEVIPKSCHGSEKVQFGTNCTIMCKKGFTLEGPRIRLCGGRTGIWTQRHNVNRCVDKIAPSLKCPADIIVENLPGENYAHVNWVAPNVSDNTDKSPKLWTKPHITFPWKAKIGTRPVIYVAQDSSGNKARCKFKVKVLDKEPPMIENCISSVIFYTDRKIGVVNVTWDEPGFYDNSKTPVQVEQSHRPKENIFPIGLTKVIYNATDKYDNTATCVINVRVKDLCQDVPVPSSGFSKCTSTMENGIECVFSCKDGYGFAIDPTNFQVNEDQLLLKCNKSDLASNNDNYFPDCSEIEVPKILEEEVNVVLEGNASVCDNQTTLRELSEYITEDLKSTLLDICGNDIECNLVSFDPECKESVLSSESVYTNLTRKRREEFNIYHVPNSFINDIVTTNSINNLRRIVRQTSNNNRHRNKLKKGKGKIEIRFKFVGRIIEENIENPKEGVQKLRQKLKSLAESGKLNLLNNKTNQEIAKLALNLHIIFKEPQELCSQGSILKKHSCVKCPLGTFYNASSKRCNPCLFGQFQDKTGSLECKTCPEKTFTKKMHAKSLQDCIAICRPGSYSRRKRYHGSHLALEPCLMCDIGFYQPQYGQNQCLPCPENSTTRNRGSANINDCLFHSAENMICQREPCVNGGKCFQEEDSFTCECRDHYVGSTCETFQNPCDSSPCLNEGICILQYQLNNSELYYCNCKNKYTGRNCEIYIDECSTNPCQNGGKCVSTDSDYTCECKDGFEGEFCEVIMDHCEPSPCEEGSTCRIINETWQCFCRPGFLGRHCNLLPCDWLPCHPNKLCINIEENNATRNSYKCECPDGYTGENCATKIDYCKNSPCLNDGECVNQVFNYTCVCAVTFTGSNCETELSSDYVMNFIKSGTTDYVMMRGPTENFSELTACLWLQSKDTNNYGTVLSYATRYYDNAFTLTDYNGFVLYINGQKVVTDVKVNDGQWHFLCVTWQNKNGAWGVFIDGFRKDYGMRLAKGTVIQGNGSFVIGQEQDRVGGGFSASESFLGKLTLMDVWNTVLTENDIRKLTNTCEKYHGNIIAWGQLREYVHGDVVVLNSTFCRGCPLPVVPFKGNINISEDLSEITYYCDTGYVVRFYGKEYKFLKIKCLKQGQWEGFYSPSCIRKKCGFPGYFPRGRIHGRSYLFGDEIHYSCMSGYELRGNPHRICNSEGKWTGLPPICIGKTCRNLLAPENGDIEYIIEENERDDISILQAGQQLEFKCDNGYHLMGERFLTCLESGLWDHDRPTCIVNGCPQPKMIEHGYVILGKVNADNKTLTLNAEHNTAVDNSQNSYDYGDIINVSCSQGYKFHKNQSLISEFQLECSQNGTWIGSIPNCIPLKCPWPNAIEKAKIILKMQDNRTLEIPRNSTYKEQTANFEDKDVKDLFVPGTQILIACDAGYKLIGDDIISCTDKETWSSMSSCEPRYCSLIDYPLFNFINNKEYNIFFESNTNMSVEDQRQRWNSIKNYSGSYKSVRYFIEGNSYKDGIILSCKNGDKMRFHEFNKTLANITYSCNQDGQWEPLNLSLNDTMIGILLNNSIDRICREPICDFPKIPEHGYIVNNTKIVNDSNNINSAITFKCRHGYLLKGNEKSVCLPNGTWSFIPVCKPVICGKPPILANGITKNDTAEKENFIFGNIITYQCLPGFLLFGQPSTRCLANGKWSRIHSKCSKISCNKPKLAPGVTIHGRSYLYQDQLTYVCPNGKKRGTITCKADGKWSDSPICSEN